MENGKSKFNLKTAHSLWGLSSSDDLYTEITKRRNLKYLSEIDLCSVCQRNWKPDDNGAEQMIEWHKAKENVSIDLCTL